MIGFVTADGNVNRHAVDHADGPGSVIKPEAIVVASVGECISVADVGTTIEEVNAATTIGVGVKKAAHVPILAADIDEHAPIGAARHGVAISFHSEVVQLHLKGAHDWGLWRRRNIVPSHQDTLGKIVCV